MSEPVVSCVIAAYDAARFLGECLDSVLSQTYRNLEIILVDDGSTDQTPQVARSFGDRIRYIRQDNAGCSAARNRGLDEATGDFLAFQDADDLWEAEKIAKQLACFRQQPNLDYCVCHVQNFWMPELEAEEKRFERHPRGRPVPGYVAQALLTRRSFFESIGRYDEGIRYAESIDWFLRANRQGAVFELLPDVLVHRRMHGGNSTREAAVDDNDEVLRLLKKRLDEARGRTT